MNPMHDAVKQYLDADLAFGKALCALVEAGQKRKDALHWAMVANIATGISFLGGAEPLLVPSIVGALLCLVPLYRARVVDRLQGDMEPLSQAGTDAFSRMTRPLVELDAQIAKMRAEGAVT